MIAFVGLETRTKTTRRVTPTRAEAILNDALVEAGITHPTHLRVGDRIPPKARVIVALGPEAARWLLPDLKIGPKSIDDMRGYVFDSPLVDAPVILTVHPANVEISWSPWRTLLSFDLQRAQELSRERLRRPVREVFVVSSDHDARSALAELRRYRRLAADLENDGDTNVSCLGFAGESSRAIVFPARYLDAARELLRRPDLTTVWVNGIYDLFVLKHRNAFEIPGHVDDAMIAWHAAYPELAGARENKRKHRVTRKSLAFLASLATFDPWWKNYEFAAGSIEQFTLNGRDCCTTLDVWDWCWREVKRVGAEKVYEHERSLMWPCVDMLARGLRVDDSLRRERIIALETRKAEVEREANLAILPLLERERETLEALGVLHLFQETDGTCPCCRHAAKKQARCWSCAGFTSAPSKAELVEYALKNMNMTIDRGTKADYESYVLDVCKVCKGAPRETRWAFNANSPEQMKVLLYDILKLPKRFSRNGKGQSTLTVDEQALKGLLAGIET